MLNVESEDASLPPLSGKCRAAAEGSTAEREGEVQRLRVAEQVLPHIFASHIHPTS